MGARCPIPSLKLTFSPLKMDGWKMNFLLGFGLFSGAFTVKLREGNSIYKTGFLAHLRLGRPWSRDSDIEGFQVGGFKTVFFRWKMVSGPPQNKGSISPSPPHKNLHVWWFRFHFFGIFILRLGFVVCLCFGVIFFVRNFGGWGSHGMEKSPYH